MNDTKDAYIINLIRLYVLWNKYKSKFDRYIYLGSNQLGQNMT